VKRVVVSIVALLIVLAAGVMARAAPSAPPKAPSTVEVRTWLEDQQRAERSDLRRWNRSREVLDRKVRANTRPLFRQVLIPVINASTLAEARARAQHALDVLAAPGPADSASKRLHTAERQATAEAKQVLKRHLTQTASFLAEFP
jgi:hypothetical protein